MSTFLKQWAVVTFVAALTLTVIDAALLQRSRSLFTGGFLTVHQLETTGEMAAFVASSLLIDAGVAGVLAVIAMLALGSMRPRRITVLAGGLMAAAGPLIVADVIGYQLVRYLGTTFDLGLMFDLTGRSVAEVLAVSSAHVAVPAMILVASTAVAGGLLWFINRRPGPTAERPSLRVLGVPLAVAAVGAAALVIAVSTSDALANSLVRKPAGRVLTSAVNTVTDVDRDGYGLVGTFKDPDPFDAAVSPYAPDIPGNGIDEDGLAGDLSHDAPRYEERPIHATGWQRRPDVVLVVLESFRADLLGARHNGRAITPVLNGLADAGIHSDQAYSHNGYTVQSRYHMLAGTLTARVGATTLIDDFKANGYVVGYFSGQDESFGADAYRIGFDRADVAYDARADVDRRYSTHATPGSLALPFQAVLDSVNTFIEARRADQRPLFLYVNFEDTHFPYTHDEVEDLVSDARLPRERIAPERRDDLWATYVNTAANVDRAVGRVLSQLQETRGRQPAVIVTADHGESLYEEGFLGHGYALNDVQTRVPLIAAHLPIRIEEPFSHLDLRSAITGALAITDGGTKPTVVAANRPVLQYLGDLRRPRQIALLHEGRRFIFDFRADRVQTWDGVWHGRPALPAGDKATLQRLIQQWEWINLSLKRDSVADVE